VLFSSVSWSRAWIHDVFRETPKRDLAPDLAGSEMNVGKVKRLWGLMNRCNSRVGNSIKLIKILNW
jgi:hypothetical protein